MSRVLLFATLPAGGTCVVGRNGTSRGNATPETKSSEIQELKANVETMFGELTR